jgi:hypothetical protein
MTEKTKEDAELDALMDRYGMKSPKTSEKKPAPKIEVPAQEEVSPKDVVVEEAPMRENPFIEMQRIKEEEDRNKPPENVLERNRGLAETGAVLGGAAKYKGMGSNLATPAPDLFAHRDANITIGQKAPLIPVAAPQPVTDIEHILQSGQEARPQVSGRQKESGHNWETNRQALAQQQGLSTQGAKELVVNAGPMVPTSSGIAIPKNVAVQMEQELQAKQAAEAIARDQALAKQAAEQQRIAQQQANRAKAIGTAKGVARVGQGVAGGALAIPQLYEYGRDVISGVPSKPADTTQGISGVGGLMMALGKGKTGALGALAQIPYAVKHRKELAASMGMSDINPTAFMGMPEEMQPAFPQLQKP